LKKLCIVYKVKCPDLIAIYPKTIHVIFKFIDAFFFWIFELKLKLLKKISSHDKRKNCKKFNY